LPRELQSSYDGYAKKLINRELFVPINAVSESVDVAREAGTKITKKAADLFDNSFADNLQKTGFLRELWGEGSIDLEKVQADVDEASFLFSDLNGNWWEITSAQV
jgi:hypothetical protein